MAAISGQGGAVKSGTNMLMQIGVWEITLTGKEVDTTPFQSPDAWEQHTPTVKGWTAKATGRWDGADTNGQVAMIQQLAKIVSMHFMVDDVSEWAGDAALIGMHPKADAVGVVTMEYDFQGHGPCDYNASVTGP